MGLAVLGERLGSMIWESFSNLRDSWFQLSQSQAIVQTLSCPSDPKSLSPLLPSLGLVRNGNLQLQRGRKAKGAAVLVGLNQNTPWSWMCRIWGGEKAALALAFTQYVGNVQQPWQVIPFPFIGNKSHGDWLDPLREGLCLLPLVRTGWLLSTSSWQVDGSGYFYDSQGHDKQEFPLGITEITCSQFRLD